MMADADWMRRAELTDLLRACRGRLARPVPAGRSSGLRQEDAAALAGLSPRRYAAFERGEFIPAAGVVDQVAAALQMSEAERSALHVLATGQDPPRTVGRPGDALPREPSQALRDLVAQLGPFPGALTDEMWTLLHYNPALDAWSGGWYSSVPPERRNLLLYLFSKGAEDLMPDIRALRRVSLAALRYQYTRNLSSPGADELVGRLLASPEAAGLWARHEVVFQPHEYQTRIRHDDRGEIADAHIAFLPASPRRWLYTMILPPGISPPAS